MPSTELPAPWLAPDINGRATPVAPNEFKRAEPIIRRETLRYPSAVLRRNLKAVNIVKEIWFFGAPYGGTNDNETVYLSIDSIQRGYTSDYIARSFHHEFSSILLRNFSRSLDQAAWAATLPKGFQYGAGGVEAIKQGKASTDFDQEEAAKGFYSKYSLAEQEEDFNILAENLFMGGSKFWKRVDSNPPLAAKVKLVLSFYNKIDNSFTESSFRQH
ncbi:MAG: hypothetical protein WCK51_02915 [Armatimonadota bacterium]